MTTVALTARSARVKAARALRARPGRRGDARFLAEGPQAVREALALGDCVLEVFAGQDAGAEHADLHEAARASGVPWLVVDEPGLRSLSETVTPQGVVAVCVLPEAPLVDVLARGPRLLAVCVDVRDPGNAGTVVRCADAAGADAVVLAGTSVDPRNGKAVRASAGSLFHLPVARGVSGEDAVAASRSAGLLVLAADGGGEVDLDDLVDAGDLRAATTWLFGNEARGLPEELSARADHRVRIPVHGRAESLNLATAAAVCLYASARAQRRRGTPATA